MSNEENNQGLADGGDQTPKKLTKTWREAVMVGCFLTPMFGMAIGMATALEYDTSHPDSNAFAAACLLLSIAVPVGGMLAYGAAGLYARWRRGPSR